MRIRDLKIFDKHIHYLMCMTAFKKLYHLYIKTISEEEIIAINLIKKTLR